MRNPSLLFSSRFGLRKYVQPPNEKWKLPVSKIMSSPWYFSFKIHPWPDKRSVQKLTWHLRSHILKLVPTVTLLLIIRPLSLVPWHKGKIMKRSSSSWIHHEQGNGGAGTMGWLNILGPGPWFHAGVPTVIFFCNLGTHQLLVCFSCFLNFYYVTSN